MSHKHHHHECHDDSCSSGQIAHTHECCNCCCHQHEHDDNTCHFSDQLLELADDAWMELLKEKIKVQIEKASGKNLDELAKLVNEANHQRWHEFFAEKRGDENFKEKLREFFHQTSHKR